MFIGAVMPGFVLVSLYLIWIVVMAIFRPASAPAMPAHELEKFQQSGMMKQIIRAFVLPFILVILALGSIFAGITSPTEAAAVGALGPRSLGLRRASSATVL